MSDQTITTSNETITLPAGVWLMERKQLDGFFRRVHSQSAAIPASDPAASQAKPTMTPRVATLELRGVMMKYGLGHPLLDRLYGVQATMPLAAEFTRLAADDANKAAVLVIDSPGGYSDSVGELATAMRTYRKAGKKIDVYVSDMAASAAYWIASQADHIVAGESAWIGSIGVYSVLVDDTEYWNKLGVKFELVNTGQFKGLGADGKITDDLRADEQRIVDAIKAQFVAEVAAGRGVPESQIESLADGRVFTSTDAASNGLVDEVSTVDRASNHIEEILMAESNQAALDAATAELAALKDRVAKLEKPATSNELRTQFPDESDNGFIIDQLGKDATLAEASKEYVPFLRGKLAAAQKALADSKSEIEKLTAGQPAVGFVAAAPVDQPVNENPAEQAKAEWAKMDDNAKSMWIDEAMFIRVRTRELSRK